LDESDREVAEQAIKRRIGTLLSEGIIKENEIAQDF